MKFLFYKKCMLNRKDDDVRLLDFQCLRLGRPSIDLSYFLLSATTPVQRENELEQLLDFYHEKLEERLALLGFSRNYFTRDQLERDFWMGYGFGLYTASAHIMVQIRCFIVLNKTYKMVVAFQMSLAEELPFDADDIGKSNSDELQNKNMEKGVAQAAKIPEIHVRMLGLAIEAEKRGFLE